MMMNLKIHERTTYCHIITEYKVYNKFLLYHDGEQKEREIAWINTGVMKSKEENGVFMDINHAIWRGARHILECCGKNSEIICCRRCRKFKDN